ncbi:MAG: efflux RND transporter periplasmic adaptor subunit [Candidatus Omnitrophica bacterium]|nr:efflux RND transporter periplasmic adaptor subunit [Candidatus Omnitrophota bacterium]
MKPISFPRWTRPRTKAAVLIALALLGGFTAVRIFHAPGRHAAHASKEVYYCPMHPSYTSDKPGDCPICNMKLVKREPGSEGELSEAKPPQAPEEICLMHNCPKLHEGRPCPMVVVAQPGEEVICPVCGTHVAGPEGLLSPAGAPASGPEGYTPILLSPRKRQFIGVTTAPAQRRMLHKIIRTVGQIANDPELYQAQQEYLQALRALEQAKAGAMPEIIERSQRLADASRLRLNRLGISGELIEEIGGWDGPDQSLLLADPSGRVWLYAPVYEFELPLVKAGQTVTAEVSAIPGKKLEGVIRSVDTVLDPVTRTARVRAVLTDPDKVLRPEMFVNASIAVASGEALAVPEEAVFDTGARRIVFVDKGQGLFEPRDVTVGVKAEGYHEIKSGVAEGEIVVTSGNFLIDSESRLKAALEGMSGAGHQHGQ